jgi:DNA-binding winged helix-turn-helix (wHTH) protein/tetratricopeptide (TPR) repeat protein
MPPGNRGSALVAIAENSSDARNCRKPEARISRKAIPASGSEPAELNRRREESHSPEALSDSSPAGPACAFAGLRLEADGTLWRGAQVVHLPLKELEALRLLIARAGQVVSPAQLKHALWGDVHVTADSVLKCLSSLRARLAPDLCIQTVYKRGYRFSAEIKRPGNALAGTPLRLAIMPFATRNAVPEHLGPALAEETIATLASLPQPPVAVLARDSVFNLTGRGLTAQQIGRELNADLVLTGSLQAFCSHCRLRAEMIRVEDGVQIWVEDVLAPRGQALSLERELLRRLAFRLGCAAQAGAAAATGLDCALPWSDRPAPPEQNQANIEIHASAAGVAGNEQELRRAEAYELLLRARHEWQSLQRHRMQDGLQNLLRAIELDPSLIAAKVDLAHLCVTGAFYGFMSPSVSADFVHRTAEEIPGLPRRAGAFLPALGWINFHFDRDLPAALQAFSASAQLPYDPWIARTRTMFALSRHRFAEAIALLRAAIRIDPFSPWLRSRLAWALHLDGQAAESLEEIKETYARFPNREEIGLYGSLILAFNGETGRAVELAQRLAKVQPFFDPVTAAHAYTLACAGRKNEARSILERMQWLSRERFLLSSFTPAIHVALGDLDAALGELRVAEQMRCPWFFQMLADPRLKPLQGRPEFERMQAILPAMEAAAARNPRLEN